MILFNTDEVKFNLKNKLKLKKWIQSIIDSYQEKTGDITYIFCTDDYLLQINKEHLNHDTLTDIITFDYTIDHPKKAISGDIFISIDRIKENAETFKKSFDNELCRVIIHGVLHLLGHLDKTSNDQKKMTLAEDKSLESLSQFL